MGPAYELCLSVVVPISQLRLPLGEIRICEAVHSILDKMGGFVCEPSVDVMMSGKPHKSFLLKGIHTPEVVIVNEEEKKKVRKEGVVRTEEEGGVREAKEQEEQAVEEEGAEEGDGGLQAPDEQ